MVTLTKSSFSRRMWFAVVPNFFLNADPLKPMIVEDSAVDPEWTLLYYLRNKLDSHVHRKTSAEQKRGHMTSSKPTTRFLSHRRELKFNSPLLSPLCLRCSAQEGQSNLRNSHPKSVRMRCRARSEQSSLLGVFHFTNKTNKPAREVSNIFTASFGDHTDPPDMPELVRK
uniref:Uncharacterized protein n=1 Tax=Timema poppense TaxID=170557 RepID=A0A7R9DD99_TIMPO|nr:unnamed protein product [Timema poppensis]